MLSSSIRLEHADVFSNEGEIWLDPDVPCTKVIQLLASAGADIASQPAELMGAVAAPADKHPHRSHPPATLPSSPKPLSDVGPAQFSSIVLHRCLVLLNPLGLCGGVELALTGDYHLDALKFADEYWPSPQGE